MVHAVLFFSPTCPHCQLVINNTLPPLFEKYGEQFDLFQADITQTSGRDLFIEAIQKYNLSGSVPALMIGDSVLVGSVDIPEQLPALIEHYLAQGGVDWPDIPGLQDLLSATQPSTANQPTQPDSAFPPSQNPTETAYPLPGQPIDVFFPNNLINKFNRDPLGNGIAILVLLGMICSCIYALVTFRKPPAKRVNQLYWRLIPFLCLLGLCVAGYLAYVEITRVSAVCGLVGDCNAVHQSQYARLFGIFPIGVLGMLGYLVILLSWVPAGKLAKRQTAYANIILFGFAAFGVIFSIYLTFLEPFVIGATCTWCLTSAIIMTAILWLSLPSAKRAWKMLYSR